MKPRVLAPLCLSLLALSHAGGEDVGDPEAGGVGVGAGLPAGEPSAALREAVAKLEIPGVTISLEERSVDIEAEVVLKEGLLELVACTQGSKEHESVVAVRARPSHIHTALLLLGGRPGNPAMRRPAEGGDGRLVDIPPRGGLVDVYLLFADDEGELREHPISEFIEGSGVGGGLGDEVLEEGAAFPTHTFLFAGSILEEGGGDGPRYLSDQSGHLISLATFGDEVLCLPGVHDQANGALQWRVKGEGLPEIGSEILLRLRPRAGDGEGAGEEGRAP